MAYNKHKLLARLMEVLINEIDQQLEEVGNNLNFIQFHFYEKKYILGRPLMTLETLKTMIRCHYIGLQNFSPSTKLKHICTTTPWGLSAIIAPEIIFKSQIILRQTEGYFIPWGVYLTLPEENLEKHRGNRHKMLLCCQKTSEPSKVNEWFEKDEASNSIIHQLLTIRAHYSETDILKKKLQNCPFQLYREAIIDWKKNSTVDDVAKNPKNLYQNDFAPQPNQTVEQAYGAVIKSAQEHTAKHRQDLRFRYLVKLEKQIFNGLLWSGEEKLAFLEKMKANFLNLDSLKKSGKDGRWEQNAGIDCLTAANFIEHFVLEFIGNPAEYQSGEIACILWTLIWCAQGGYNNKVTVEEVRNLTSKQISHDKHMILFKNCNVPISKGLHEFLTCLMGKGSGKREKCLFENIDKKGLERSLKKTSIKILPEGVTPVLPAAFLVSPHLQTGQRISSVERQLSKKIRQLVPHRHMSEEILKIIKKQRKRLKNLKTLSVPI